jgi:hypothetical protein
MDDPKHAGRQTADVTDSDLITYTQVGCCAVSDYTSKPQRLSLRARLQREREEREERRQASFINTFRNLFGSSRH